MSLTASHLFSVHGLVAVITGGGSGIGLMMTKALAQNGAAKVYIVGRRKEVLENAAKECSVNGNVVALVGDVTSKTDLEKIAARVKEETGYVNVLIANSGIAGPQSPKKDSGQGVKTLQEFQADGWNQDVDAYRNTFTVNVTSIWFTAMAFLNLLDGGNRQANVPQKSQIIATSSIAGFNRQAPGGFAYGQSKAAVTHLMKQLATALAPYSIRGNVIAPGLYPSQMSVDLIGDGKFPKDILPLERVGTEEDMAGCILYLTSQAGAYLNGNVVVTDGGRLSVTAATY